MSSKTDTFYRYKPSDGTHFRGRLYRIKSYPLKKFSLWSCTGVAQELGFEPKIILTMPIRKAVFLYLGFVEARDERSNLHHVICGNLVGAIDIKVILEPLRKPE